MTGHGSGRLPALECMGVSKTFGGLCAVEDVSLAFNPGSISAIIGPNGAGKTTLFHLLSGTLSPSKGTIRYGGGTIEHATPWLVARCGVGRLFQDVRIFRALSVHDNIMMGFSGQFGERFWDCLATPWKVRRQERGLSVRSDEVLKRIGLSGLAHVSCGELSFGQQKMVALGRLLAGEYKVLLLDEPAAGVGADVLARVRELIRGLAREGCAIVVIEHDMMVVRDLADTVHFMNEGRVVASGSPSAVLDDPSVRSMFLGI